MSTQSSEETETDQVVAENVAGEKKDPTVGLAPQLKLFYDQSDSSDDELFAKLSRLTPTKLTPTKLTQTKLSADHVKLPVEEPSSDPPKKGGKNYNAKINSSLFGESSDSDDALFGGSGIKSFTKLPPTNSDQGKTDERIICT